MMYEWFECKIEYKKTLENGAEKKKLHQIKW